MKWPRTENWKAETQLKELHPDELLTIMRPGQPALRVTVRELIEEAGISGALTIEQVEWAFSDRPLDVKNDHEKISGLSRFNRQN